MNRTLKRILTEYGMLLVLFLLCVFFSVATWSRQSPVGESAARQMIGQLKRQYASGATLLIVARGQPDDLLYTAALQRELDSNVYLIRGVVNGEPRDVRAAIEKISENTAESQPSKLDVIVGTQETANWLIFRDLSQRFPHAGNPEFLSPTAYYWPNFLKAENLLNIANQIAVIAIIAIGMTMVIISGGIDLSVGSLIAFSAVVCARWIRDVAGAEAASTAGMLTACIIAVVGCAMVGAFSGLLVTTMSIPPFIVTLAVMLVASGTAYILADGQSVYQIPESFVWLGRGTTLGGVPNAVVLMLLLYGAAHILMSCTTLGRYLYAVGGNCEAARLSGVPITRIRIFAYIASGSLAGLGGVIMASQLKSGSPTYGGMYELYVIAAAVVGGTSLNGGEGKMPGTLIGALTIAVIQNGMNLTNVESYTQKVVLGLVILAAVMLDLYRSRQ